jgi:multisubunit Na+/H+ antiporter MnhG subunit
MSQVLIVFGVLIVLAGLFAVMRPTRLLRLARGVTVGTWLRFIAFLIRSLLGVLLILVAPSTDIPLVMKVIGSLLIISGVAVILLGNSGVQRLLNWALRLGPSLIIVGGIVGVLFGAFLIYVGV